MEELRVLAASLAVVAVAAVGCGRSTLTIPGAGAESTEAGGVAPSQPDSGSEPLPDGASVAEADAESDAPDAQQPGPDCGAGDGLVTLASGQTGPGGLAVDQANIYWLVDTSANGQTGTVSVMKESLCGGPISTLASVPGHDSSSIVIYGHDVYWAEQGAIVGNNQVTPNQLFRVPVEGGAVSTLWSSQELHFMSLAVAPSGIYGTAGPGYGNGSVVRVPFAGGPSATLGSGFWEPWGLTVAGTMVYWVDAPSYPKPGALMAMPLGGGTPVTFGLGGAGPGEVVANSTNVFWTSGGADPSSVLSLLVTEPLAGGATTTLVGPVTDSFGPIAVDDANVYVAGGFGVSALTKIDLTGARPPTTLASANVGALAVDSTSVYWTDWYAHTVMKLTPK